MFRRARRGRVLRPLCAALARNVLDERLRDVGNADHVPPIPDREAECLRVTRLEGTEFAALFVLGRLFADVFDPETRCGVLGVETIAGARRPADEPNRRQVLPATARIDDVRGGAGLFRVDLGVTSCEPVEALGRARHGAVKERALEVMTHRFEVRELFAGTPRNVIVVQLRKLLVDDGDRFECFEHFAAICGLPMRQRRGPGAHRTEQRRNGTERAFVFKPGDVPEQFALVDDLARRVSFRALRVESTGKVGHRGVVVTDHAIKLPGCFDGLFREVRCAARTVRPYRRSSWERGVNAEDLRRRRGIPRRGFGFGRWGPIGFGRTGDFGVAVGCGAGGRLDVDALIHFCAIKTNLKMTCFASYVVAKRGSYAVTGFAFDERRSRLRSGSVKGFGRGLGLRGG